LGGNYEYGQGHGLPVDLFDVMAGKILRSQRMAKRAGAIIMRGTIVENGAVEIDESELEKGEQWTPLDFKP
jgi:hypothetical protein